LSAGTTQFDSKRNLVIQANGGPVLLSQKLTGKTDALSLGARVIGGYDFDFGALKSGPVRRPGLQPLPHRQIPRKQDLRTP
jgi:uncharacterized protein YhjY with autotransporter beta-barrel domain